MKALLLIMLAGSIIILGNQIAFADGHYISKYKTYQKVSSNTCYKPCVRRCQPCPPRGPELDCNCTDPGMYYNYCISRSTYCKAFGNVGALED